MASTILLTGFPGFLANPLLDRLYHRLGDDATLSCLVEPGRLAVAERTVEVLNETSPGLADRVRLYEGDITDPTLGQSEGRLRFFKGAVTEIYHLAAAYDLAISPGAARAVNLLGTRHLLELAGRCSKLRRFHYVSTCYVSGEYDGLFHEDDLNVGQTFHNHYEASKYYAEQAVHDAMDNGLPVTVYRPSIVVGDSDTGETAKYDGLYYVLQWMLRLPNRFVFPDFGSFNSTEVNVVPRDYVVAAIDTLAARDDNAGRTYHLSDPHPLTVRQFLDLYEEITGQHLYTVRMPKPLTQRLAGGLPGVRHWVRIPMEIFDYYTHPTRYDTTNAERDLKGSGVQAPPLDDYLAVLIDFLLEHPEAR